MESFVKGKQDFDLLVVHSELVKCVDGEDVNLRHYLAAYRELCRFFKLSGPLFAFVAKDIEGKLSVIESKVIEDKSQNYKTVQSMVKYEVLNDLVSSQGHRSSGSRTMLRLHWALEFILEFMSRIRSSSDDDKVSTIAAEVYNQTLSNHHPWITRKMASFAIYFLPSRKDLINTMCKQDYDTVLCLLEKVVQAGRTVYGFTESVYKYYDLLYIP